MPNILVEIEEETFYEIGDIIKKAEKYERILMVLSDAIATKLPITFDADTNLLVDNVPIGTIINEWYKAGLFNIIEEPKAQEELI